MDTNNIVDVSSFLLFEASDDSDSTMIPWVGFENGLCMDGDDDDAESSCGNSLYSACVNELNDSQVVEPEEEEFPEDEQEEEGEVVKASKVRPNAEASIAATKIPMNETEESQLFWETCLAS